MSARLAGLLALLLATGALQAATYPLPPPGVDVVGQDRTIRTRHEDTLVDLASEHRLGYDEILLANPQVDRWLPGEGTPVILPGRHILPDSPRRGIVLNLAERRLYYYPEPEPGDTPVVVTYPVGIGRVDWQTPLGMTRIVTKQANPAWHPPESIRQEHLAQYGEPLPAMIPPGPDNPLGPYALRLSIPGYLIHGTNKPYGVGSRVSHGCVRLYNEDIGDLFRQVPLNTPVAIVNQPIKVGLAGGTVYLEAHPPLEEPGVPNGATLDEALRILRERAGAAFADRVDLDALLAAIDRADGLVAPIGD
ncbi:MAG: L,D-transpeptidase family protein [Candidatus Competibacterales bacterium]|nr:L,D-transpeptidase family protein [Candidatus Competibacterales bacterium]